MKFDFEKETGKLFLRLENIVLPNFYIPDINLLPKKEFHITLIAYRLAESICTSTGKSHEEIASLIEPIINSTEPFFERTGRYYLLYKKYSNTDERASVIELITSSHIEKMFEEISAVLGIKIEAPFLHITLYTTGTNNITKDQGIGVATAELFKKVMVTELYPDN